MMFKSLNGLAPVYLHELFSERHTDYDLPDSFRKLYSPKPRSGIWNVALATAVPYCGILFLKALRRSDPFGSLRMKSTTHLKHLIPLGNHVNQFL